MPPSVGVSIARHTDTQLEHSPRSVFVQMVRYASAPPAPRPRAGGQVVVHVLSRFVRPRASRRRLARTRLRMPWRRRCRRLGARCCERICERNAAQQPRSHGMWCNGVGEQSVGTCTFETREDMRDRNRLAHNPEVADPYRRRYQRKCVRRASPLAVVMPLVNTCRQHPGPTPHRRVLSATYEN